MLSTISSPAPPQAPLRFDHTPTQLVEEAQSLVLNTKKIYDNLAVTIQPADATFENTILPIMLDGNTRGAHDKVLRFYSSTHPDASLREASTKAAEILSGAAVDAYLRDDIFALVDAVVKKGEPLDSESQHVLNKLHREFVDNGINILEKSERDRFSELRKKISELSRQHTNNMNNEAEGLWLSPDELAGLPQDTIDNLKAGDSENAGKLLLTFKNPHYFAAMKFLVDGDVRRKVYTGRDNRAPGNVELLRDIVILRDEAARLLGFPNHASYRISGKMAQKVEVVNEFLGLMAEQSKPLVKAAVNRILEYKRADLEARGEKASNAKLYLWDQSYYSSKVKKEESQIDDKLIKEYFETDHTLSEIFAFFEHLFGIKLFKSNFPTWHPDVQAFAAWDADKENEFLGFLYLDLYPRDSKHTHGGHYGLLPGFTKPDGTRHYPASVIVINFPPPTEAKPSLLPHTQVRSLFTIMGHSLHNLLSHTRFASVHGPNSDLDFVKVPAKMMEKFFWKSEVITKISHHYADLKPEWAAAWKGNLSEDQQHQNPPVKLTDEVAQTLLRDRPDRDAQSMVNDLYRAIFDIKIHSPATHEEIENMDLAEVYHRLRYDLTGLAGPEDEDPYHFSNPQSVFRLIIGKQDAGYYTQIYSRILAYDLFDFGFKDNFFSKEAGRRFRYKLLEKGGSQPEMITIEEYLGRKPSTKAFCDELGIENF